MRHQPKIAVKAVQILGAPVGNLWDVFFDDRLVGRVTYHGNNLVCVSGMVGQRQKVEQAIEELYK